MRTLPSLAVAAALLGASSLAAAQYDTYIELSKPSWSTELADAQFYIQPGWASPNNEVPHCTFSHPKVLAYSKEVPPTVTGGLVTIDAREARKLPAGKNTLTVTCGGKSVPFTVDNTYPALTKPLARFDDSDAAAMRLTLVRPQAQLDAAKPVSVWIAAVVPGHVFGLPGQQVFFLTRGAGGAPQWQQMVGGDVEPLVYARGLPGEDTQHDVAVNFGFGKQDLAGIGAQVMFAYRNGQQAPQLLDAVWNPAIPTAPKGKYTDHDRLYTFETLNRVRGLTGVGFVKQHEALDKAAQAHAEYLINSYEGHEETPGKPGFTGVQSEDRAAHFGYFSTTLVGEELAGGAGNMLRLWRLLGAPLHSAGMLGGRNIIGVGASSKSYTVINGGLLNGMNYIPQNEVAVFPCNNMQVNVQSQGYETPLPSALNGKEDFGYSSLAKTRFTHPLVVQSWELRDAQGRLIPTVVEKILPETSALIPLDALPRTVASYTSILKGTNNGIPFEKICTFRTVAGNTIPIN